MKLLFSDPMIKPHHLRRLVFCQEHPNTAEKMRKSNTAHIIH